MCYIGSNVMPNLNLFSDPGKDNLLGIRSNRQNTLKLSTGHNVEASSGIFQQFQNSYKNKLFVRLSHTPTHEELK